MLEFCEFFRYIFNPEWIFIRFGSVSLFIFLAIIFAETGLLIGFFLPGDSLLFAAGIFSNSLSKSFYNLPFVLIVFLVSLVAIFGNIVGYLFGYKSGPLLLKKKNTFFFKKKYLISAKIFYIKYKTIALIISRFLPILRTFAPILAGVVRVDFKKFMIYNIIGGFSWVFSIMMAGHYLDKIFPALKNNLSWIVILVIIFTTIPIFLKIFINNKKK